MFYFFILNKYICYDNIMAYSYKGSNTMPTELQFIDFAIGIVGLILTIGTLATSLNLKKHLVKRVEIESFRNKKQDILNKIDGYINSINEDKIFSNDDKQTFRAILTQFAIEIQSSYTFLSKNSKQKLKSVHDLLNKYPIYWENVASELVALKSYLQKEII